MKIKRHDRRNNWKRNKTKRVTKSILCQDIWPCLILAIGKPAIKGTCNQRIRALKGWDPTKFVSWMVFKAVKASVTTMIFSRLWSLATCGPSHIPIVLLLTQSESQYVFEIPWQDCHYNPEPNPPPRHFPLYPIPPNCEHRGRGLLGNMNCKEPFVCPSQNIQSDYKNLRSSGLEELEDRKWCLYIPIKPNAPPSKRRDNGGPLSFCLENKIRLTIGMKPHWKRSRLTKELGLERRE